MLRGDTDFSQTTSSTAGTTTGCASSSASTPRPTWSSRRTGKRKIPTELAAGRAPDRETTPDSGRKTSRSHRWQRGTRRSEPTPDEVGEFAYRPTACKHAYRMVVAEEPVDERGENGSSMSVLLLHHQRLEAPPEVIVEEANQRCNQENLIGQLKSGVRSLTPPWTACCATGPTWSDGLVGVEPESLGCACSYQSARAGPSVTTSNAGACSPWTSAPSSPPSSTSPARSSPPADAYGGASSPTTHGSERSSACSTPSDTPHQPQQPQHPPSRPPATPAGHGSDPEQHSNRVIRHPPTPNPSPLNIPNPLLNTPTTTPKPHRIDPGP